MTKRAQKQIVGAGKRMERLLGELPPSTRGNRHILVFSDYFTRWTESFAMVNIEARTVADIMVGEAITRIGVPSTIH